MIENGAGWVRMTHPDVAGDAEATEQAFTEVWEPKGWAIVERYQDPSAPTIESRLEALSKDALVERATARGVASTGTKADIAAALVAAGDTGEDI